MTRAPILATLALLCASPAAAQPLPPFLPELQGFLDSVFGAPPPGYALPPPPGWRGPPPDWPAYRGPVNLPPRPMVGPPGPLPGNLPPPPGTLACDHRAAKAPGVPLAHIPRLDLIGQEFRVTRASASHAEGSLTADIVVMAIEARTGERFVLIHTYAPPWLDTVASYAPDELSPEQTRWGSKDPAAKTSRAASLGSRIDIGPLFNITMVPLCEDARNAQR